MKIEQAKWEIAGGWQFPNPAWSFRQIPQLVLVFGSRAMLSDQARFQELRVRYPLSNILSCTTAGVIVNGKVTDHTIFITAIHFEKTIVRTAQVAASMYSAYNAGLYLAEILQGENLAHLLIISDGQLVNDSELVRGLNQNNIRNIPITGGLAGDGPHFQKTLAGLVGINEPPREGNIVAVGLYGKHLKVGHGNKSGWDTFGPERMVTRSDKNILYELDGQSALELYKKFLGPLSDELPGSALLFPLCIHKPGTNDILVRTVLSIDEAKQSMTFAGDVPEGAAVHLMKANFDRLIDAAAAADSTLRGLKTFEPELAILINCIGRRLVLRHRAEEELEEVIKVLGAEAKVTGFYSYGELSPLMSCMDCELHNQTMTITTYRED